MKKYFTIILLLLIVLFTSKETAHTSSTGAPAAKTASPGDGGATCNTAYCHSGPSAQSGENISISVQPSEQGSYRISIEVSNSGGMQYEKVGFQACVEDDFGNKIGDIFLVDPIRTKFPNGNSDYITHTFTGTSPSDNFSHLWEFDWTPPSNFEGQDANVYVASILSNNNNQNNGDVHITNHYAFNVSVSSEGCTDILACNYIADAIIDDGSCIYGAENIFLNNLLDEYNLLSNESFIYFQPGTDLFSQGTSVYIQGTNLFTQGTNLLFYASISLIEYIQSSIFGLFNYFDNNYELYNCSDCINDINNDGICDELEINGCTDSNACNYDMYATIDDGSCINPETYYNCDGTCINDNDEDGICDELEVLGCTDMTACNYDIDATIDDGSCEFAQIYFDCDGNCINDYDMDGVCDEFDYDDDIGIDEISKDSPTLIKIIDIQGREQNEHNKGTFLFYIYDNGKVEKKMIHKDL